MQTSDDVVEITVENHPLEPFLPDGSRVLMLGSFPPPKARWSMDFFYPNLQNDMWRIFGWIFFENKDHFLTADGKRFDQVRLEAFLREKGVALYDTASRVRRLQGNAADKFLEFDEEDCPDLWDLIKFLFWVAVVFVGGVILGNLLGI